MGAVYGTIGCGDVEAVKAMGQVLAHRGGRACEPVTAGRAILGARTHDDAPPPWVRSSLTLIGDIDLYNSPELQAELARSDPTLDGAPVGEILLAAWQQWGPSCLSRLNGDFVLVLHDASDGSLTLARDPAGLRPLYYARWEGGLAFASEYKALLRLPDMPRKIDRHAVQFLQSRKLVPCGRSLLQGIDQVPAGTWIRVKPDQTTEQGRYYDIPLDIARRSADEHASDVRDHFLRAVDRRIPDRGPIGILVSGGIDSISVIAAARTLRPEATICAFTGGDRPDDPELHWARQASERFGAEHIGLVVPAEAMRTDLPELVWHLEDPIARSETLTALRLARKAADRVSVLLGGYAADGLFAGMPRHKLPAIAGRTRMGRRTLGEVYSFLQTGVRPSGWIAGWLVSARLAAMFPPVPVVNGSPPPDALPPWPNAGRELLNEVLRPSTIHGLQQWLQKVDRTHAAAGLRVASPFLDPDFTRAAFRVPSRLKHRIIEDKVIWRRAAAKLMPRELANRPKFPQRMQEDRHFCDVLDEVARPVLNIESVKSRGLFVPDQVERLLRRPADGVWPPEHAMRIWTLMLTELWARIFVDAPGIPPSCPSRRESCDTPACPDPSSIHG